MVTTKGTALGIEAARRLAQLGRNECRIEAGLSEAEFAHIEGAFGFQFADDHRAFLSVGLPLSVPYHDPPGMVRAWSEPWPDWRNGEPDKLRAWLNRPVEGVLFDVEHAGYWHNSWGQCPDDLARALLTAAQLLASAPVMVPVFGHRFLPAGRGTFGHPVLSIQQTDVVCYGANLADYVSKEFGTGLGASSRNVCGGARPTVAFWSDLVQ